MFIREGIGWNSKFERVLVEHVDMLYLLSTSKTKIRSENGKNMVLAQKIK